VIFARVHDREDQEAAILVAPWIFALIRDRKDQKAAILAALSISTIYSK